MSDAVCDAWCDVLVGGRGEEGKEEGKEKEKEEGKEDGEEEGEEEGNGDDVTVCDEGAVDEYGRPISVGGGSRGQGRGGGVRREAESHLQELYLSANKPGFSPDAKARLAVHGKRVIL